MFYLFSDQERVQIGGQAECVRSAADAGGSPKLGAVLSQGDRVVCVIDQSNVHRARTLLWEGSS